MTVLGAVYTVFRFLDERTARECGCTATTTTPSGVNSVLKEDADEPHKLAEAAVQDADLYGILKSVHPTVGLTHDGLSLVREVSREMLAIVLSRLSAGDDLQAAVSNVVIEPQLCDEALVDGARCIAQYNMRPLTRDCTSDKCVCVFRVQDPDRPNKLLTLNARISRRAPLHRTMERVCRRFGVSLSSTVFVYYGQSIDPTQSPRELGMETQAEVFALPVRTWNHKRRDEARRGVLNVVSLSSLKHYHGPGKRYKGAGGAVSKVRRLMAAPPASARLAQEEQTPLQKKRGNMTERGAKEVRLPSLLTRHPRPPKVPARRTESDGEGVIKSRWSQGPPRRNVETRDMVSLNVQSLCIRLLYIVTFDS